MSRRETASIRSLVSPGHMLLLALMAAGLVTAVVRYAGGIGAISNLNDDYPWGLWISLDLLCGVALAAGAFVTASAVYILGKEEFRPLLRPAILTGFLGYLMVVVALMVDLGHPERIWHLIVFWNPHSIMFEVGWCVMLYSSVLALEFSPLAFERLQMKPALRIIHAITVPLVILGTVLSTLHQSSLGSLFTIMPATLNGLWHTPLLPMFFFLTAVAVGPAMVILESTISSRVFKRGLETELLGKLALAIPLALSVYLVMKVIDLAITNEFGLLFDSGTAGLFWAEMMIGVIAPIILFSQRRVRQNPGMLLLGAVLVITGVALNRFDVSLLAIARPAGASYVPHVLELVITASVVAGGVFVYSLVARFLPLFTAHPVEEAAQRREVVASTAN